MAGVSGIGPEAYSCRSWDLVGNGFEVFETDAPYVELLSVDVESDRMWPGGNVDIEVVLAGDTIKSIEEIQLQSIDGDTLVA